MLTSSQQQPDPHALRALVRALEATFLRSMGERSLAVFREEVRQHGLHGAPDDVVVSGQVRWPSGTRRRQVWTLRAYLRLCRLLGATVVVSPAPRTWMGGRS